MNHLIYSKNKSNQVNINLPSSKSISNRALVLNALLNNKIVINELSMADDTQLMLSVLFNTSNEVNIENAGTCMRFLTAFFAANENLNIKLIGSERMKQRPIKELVDALIKLGADITYLEKPNYPPLLITGQKLLGNTIHIDASESSQFISALMLIAPFVQNGITLNLTGKIASFDFIKMTALLMYEFGFSVQLTENMISIKEYQNEPVISNYTIEKDWSSAAFWYIIAALNPTLSINLIGLSKKSIQGDHVTFNIFENLGVTSIESENGIVISKMNIAADFLTFDLINAIDLAPALCVACAALNLNATISGLQNLKIKESNRLIAIVNELRKFGYQVNNTSDEIIIIQSNAINYNQSITINTYSDHRIAMAFAPLAMLFNHLVIDDVDVVSKSYPHYFNDLALIGITMNKN
jgi:3-phosphoshikimate 1-carboxyvinyltransferase